MGILMGLFLLSPLVTLALLVTETAVAGKRKRGHAKGGFGFALALFVEALAIDLFMLSQVRM
jgi:hypothetical protein